MINSELELNMIENEISDYDDSDEGALSSVLENEPFEDISSQQSENDL